ncbi:hypothetical protein [Spirulina sp. 06S082]|uniref:hypothetical protein n=1 Tax=Spirulina sp. 06S082 TaxID=3110248 RepID=UPI002B21548B|nr:hypothetical protein [Spirulina sp. 06S082]MEA5471996.1 hypothetical protein [Spirulina sp. 06S082]
MKIAILVEGKTEIAFRHKLRAFLETILVDKTMPKLKFIPYNGRIPKEDKLIRYSINDRIMSKCIENAILGYDSRDN